MGNNYTGKEVLFRVVAPYMCFGLIMRRCFVRDAPPIVTYMHGWTFDKVQMYCVRKQFTLSVVKDNGTEQKIR